MADIDLRLHPACADMQIESAEEGRVTCTPPRKRVALVGFGSNTRELVPWANPELEVWGMNQAYQYIPRRPDRWFELHRPEFTPDMRDPGYPDWLRAIGIPIYMQYVNPDIPTSVRYPLDRVIKDLGLDYFTSSIAFMVALAIVEAFQEIHLYGIDLITDEEYAHQKPCVEWWLGVAWGRGISVYTPPECALLKQPFRYGYEVARAGSIDPLLILHELETYQKQQQKALAEYHTMSGSIQYAKHVYQLAEAAQRGSTVTLPALQSST